MIHSCLLMLYFIAYLVFLFFFFKQKTAYEMRISDWSSDVCSSDLVRSLAKPVPARLDGGMLHFLSPEYGVAPGQAAVLYDGDRVLGGGWIAVTQAADLTEAA